MLKIRYLYLDKINKLAQIEKKSNVRFIDS